MMRSILALWLVFLFTASAMAEPLQFSGPTLVSPGKPRAQNPSTPSRPLPVKASLVFHEDPQGQKNYGYPHVLQVFLRIEGPIEESLSWFVGPFGGIAAELLDAEGKSVPNPPSAASITSGPQTFFLPYGSRLDWLISDGGITMSGDRTKNYALIIGGHGWLVPINSVASYSLGIRLRGFPWVRSAEEAKSEHEQILLEVPPTMIKISK